jgi:hypothetical protein
MRERQPLCHLRHFRNSNGWLRIKKSLKMLDFSQVFLYPEFCSKNGQKSAATPAT